MRGDENTIRCVSLRICRTLTRMEPPRRPGPARSETARRAILDATARQFIERGFDALTIEGVAAEAKVGKQTIYRWWPSRTALVAECLAEGLLMPSWSVPPDSGDVRVDLREWLGNVVAFIGQPGNDDLLRSLVVAAAHDPAVAHGLSERLGILALLGDRVQRAVNSGELAPAPVQSLIEALLGALVVRSLQRSPIDAAFVDSILGLLLPERPSGTTG